MNEWELTDRQLWEAAFDSVAGDLKPEYSYHGDDLYPVYRAIATAAQKKLVEWWLENFDVPMLTPELIEKWKAFKAALGVK